tara:strand:+ start:307 stop:795 length:489 start_codon:yes stop_codon:yes gene_type:complete
MVKANTQVAKATNQVTTGAVLKGPLLTSTGAFNYAAVQTFINTKAGGNANNVAIVPCKGVTFASFTMGKGGKAPCKTLGGFNAQQYGVRQTMLWHALNGQLTLGAWLNACKSKGALGIPSGGQSATKPIVLLALLNGGFSRNANTWGMPQVQLVVKPQTVKA